MPSSLVDFFQSLIPTPKSTPKLFHLVLLASVVPILFFTALGASIAFYRAYVPQVQWRQKLYLQYGVSDNPFALAEIPSFMILPGQTYDASLDLFLPPTPANYALGNFMCNLTFVGRGGVTLSSSRPVSIVPVHPPFFSFWPFSSPYHLVIPLMESVALSTLAKPILARVEIGRQDAWRSLGAHREVQTINSELKVIAVLRGLRWWMYRYPVSSVLLSTCLFFLAASLIAAVAYLSMAPPLSAPIEVVSQPSIKQAEPSSTSKQPLQYRPYEKREESTIPLARDMLDISADPSVKSEETEGEMSDWSDTFLGSEQRLHTNLSSEVEGGAGLRARMSRTGSTDSLSTLSGDVRRRLAQ